MAAAFPSPGRRCGNGWSYSEPEDAEVTAQVAQYFSRSPESLDKTDERR